MYLGQGDIARLLISEGAFLDHHDKYGNTVAHGLFVRGVYTGIGQENINSLLKILVCVGFSDFGQVNHMEASVLSLAIRGYTPPVHGHTNDQSFRNTLPVSNPSASISRLDLAPTCSIYEPSIDSNQAAPIATTARRKNAAGKTQGCIAQGSVKLIQVYAFYSPRERYFYPSNGCSKIKALKKGC